MSLDPKYRQGLKTSELLRNDATGHQILNQNAGFFGGTSALAMQEVKLQDEFSTVLRD